MVLNLQGLKKEINLCQSKNKAQITDSYTEIIGYLIEQRESLGNGCYSNKIQYLIYVTEFSMPNSKIRGGFIVKKETIKEL